MLIAVKCSSKLGTIALPDGSPFLIIEVDIGGQGGVDRALAAVDFVAEPGKLCRRADLVDIAGFLRFCLRCAVPAVVCGQCDCGQHAEQHDQRKQERQNSFFHLYVLSQYM